MIRKVLFPVSLLGLLAGCMGTQPTAGQVEGQALITPTVGEIAEFLESKGHSPKIERDRAGEPTLLVNEEGDNFMIAFYDCSKGGGLAARRCTGAEFSISYPVKKKPTLSRINVMNQNYRMAKVYMNSDGNPGVSMAVNLGGAFSSGNLSDNLEWWVTAMRHFEEDIGWN